MGKSAAVLEVLSVGRGDLRLVFGPADVEEARKTIETMLRQGYAIFVETDNGPRRVKRFNAKRFTYIISDTPSEQAVMPKTSGPRSREREVPVRSSRARAVGATAGG